MSADILGGHFSASEYLEPYKYPSIFWRQIYWVKSTAKNTINFFNVKIFSTIFIFKTVKHLLAELFGTGIDEQSRSRLVVAKMNNIKPNGEMIARQNELYILREVRQHGVIREDELAIILNWSKQMVQRTTIRLAKSGDVLRTRAYSSFIISIKKRSNTATTIPAIWKHHALAIQALGYVREQYPKAIIETEAEIRSRIQSGKIADGQIKHPFNIRLEVEMSNKTSKPMEKQSSEIISLASLGLMTVICYPWPQSTFYKFNWEHRIASSIRSILGNDNPQQYIKLLRCWFDNVLEFDHCRPNRFEFVDLPPMPKDCRIGIGKNTIGFTEIRGYHWKDLFKGSENNRRAVITELFWDNHKKGIFKFLESPDGDLPHEMLEQILGNWEPAKAFPDNQAFDIFAEFVNGGKTNAEKIDSTTPPDVFE